MGKQCAICGGSIVNGRCRQCGMPYKRDEELYHLNEDRVDHMKHATPEARRILAEQLAPKPQTQVRPMQPVRRNTVQKTYVNKQTRSSVVEEEKNRRANAQKNKIIRWIIFFVLICYVIPFVGQIIKEIIINFL